MNLRNVLKAFTALRQLTDDESVLLETLRGLNDAERESLVVALQPKKATTAKKATTERKIEHCEVCDYTRRAAVHKDSSLSDYHEFQSGKSEKKSKRAASLSGVIQRTPKVRVDDDDADRFDDASAQKARDEFLSDMERCTVMRDGRACGLLPDHNVHHMQSAVGYHEFDAEKSTASAASGD